MKRLLVPLFLLSMSILSGCERQSLPTEATGASVIALADAQRHSVLTTTRDAAYSVFIDTDDPKKLEDPTFIDAMHGESPNGSAFAVRADGLVLTNAHVIQGTNFCTGRGLQPMPGMPPPTEEDILKETGRQKEAALREEGKNVTRCLFVTQAFSKAYRARLIKIDKVRDIAVMCLENANRQLPYLKLARSGSFKEGAEVITIGSPLGNTNMMTPGLISNLNYTAQDKETGKKAERQVQFSAPILPGNSGGPLVSVATGEVVGQVVAAILFAGKLPTGMSFANPVENLREAITDVAPCDKKETP